MVLFLVNNCSILLLFTCKRSVSVHLRYWYYRIIMGSMLLFPCPSLTHCVLYPCWAELCCTLQSVHVYRLQFNLSTNAVLFPPNLHYMYNCVVWIVCYVHEYNVYLYGVLLFMRCLRDNDESVDFHLRCRRNDWLLVEVSIVCLVCIHNAPC